MTDVLVTTPSGTSGNDPRDQFVYAPPITGPQVGSMAPPTGSVLGRDFGGDQRHKLHRRDGGDLRQRARDVVQYPFRHPGHGHQSGGPAVGSVDVTVTGPNGTSSTSLADLFVYTDPPPPR